MKFMVDISSMDKDETYLAVGTFKIDPQGTRKFVQKDYLKNDKRVSMGLYPYGKEGSAGSGIKTVGIIPFDYPLAVVLVFEDCGMEKTLYDPQFHNPFREFLKEELKLRGLDQPFDIIGEEIKNEKVS